MSTNAHNQDSHNTSNNKVTAPTRSHYYDVILMDMQMPKLSGTEASLLIKSILCECRQPKIYALTANVLPEDHEECRSAGMEQTIITKPISLKLLETVLDKCQLIQDKISANEYGGVCDGTCQKGMQVAKIAIQQAENKTAHWFVLHIRWLILFSNRQ